MKQIHNSLAFLYGEDRAPHLNERVQSLINSYRKRIPVYNRSLTERDAMLITYGDQVLAPDKKPLQTLGEFCQQQLKGVVSGIHLLPFYPWTSDDGFSVTDYRQIDPALGDWDDVISMQAHFRLMFDGVINHISAQSAWLQRFLQDDPRYRDYFITVEGNPDLSQVVRPRVHRRSKV